MSNSHGARLNLEHLRKQAKRLLKAALAGEGEALARFRILPGFMGVPALHDAQSVIARENGALSWQKLRDLVFAQAGPVDAEVERAYLAALRHGDRDRVLALEAAHPGIASHSLATMCASGSAGDLAQALEDVPEARDASTGPVGWPPLAYVVTSRAFALGPERADGLLACTRQLLGCGASPNTRYTDGIWTVPVLYAPCGETNNVALAKLLLEAGADPNDGESIVHAAQFAHIECLELLVAHGGDLSMRYEEWGNTALYFLTGFRETDIGWDVALRGMTWLLEHGADPNVLCYENQETALHGCARTGRSAETLDLLVRHGADPLICARDGRTPYAVACVHGNLETAGWLANHGASTALSSTDRLLAAFAAADAANVRAELDADPSAIDRIGPADLKLLPDAAFRGATRTVELMLEAGWPLDATGQDSGSALHCAAWKGWIDVVRVLIARGAALGWRDATHGSTPLGWAVHGSKYCRNADGDYPACVRALLDAGSDPNEPANRFGGTHVDTAEGVPEVQAVLREYGAG